MAAMLSVSLLPHLFSAAAPAAIGEKELPQSVRYQFCGFDGLAVEPAVLGCVGIKSFLERLRRHNGDRHRVLPGQRTESQISHSSPPTEASRSATRFFSPARLRGPGRD
jgi:hypothetical protein